MFDHEKLDVYRLELKFLEWATEFLVELVDTPSPVNKRDCMDRRSAPKGQQDSAQGLNPGYGALAGCALKVAPEGVRRWCGTHESNTPHRLWRPFRAHRVKTLYPGLKPWAESCRPFGAVIEDEDDDEYEDDRPGSEPHP